jgi:hypothetical protein
MLPAGWSATDLQRETGLRADVARLEIEKLLTRRIIVELPADRGRYRYNVDLPAGPRERPRSERPEIVARDTAPVEGTGRRSPLSGLPADVRRALAPAINAGWEASKTGSGHLMLSGPDGRTVRVSSTPSARQALQAIRADLRRNGAPVA